MKNEDTKQVENINSNNKKLLLSDVIKRFCSCGKELENFETGEKCYECLKIEWSQLKSKYHL